MTGLEEQLARIEQKFGKDSKIAQMVRDQIASEGTTARELYLTGSVPKGTIKKPLINVDDIFQQTPIKTIRQEIPPVPPGLLDDKEVP